LDPGRKLGFAVAVGTNVVEFGTYILQGNLDQRLAELYRWLRDRVQTVDEIAWEAPAFNPKFAHAAASLMGMAGVIRLVASETGTLHASYAPTEIKKHITGKGNSNKGPIVAWASQVYGCDVTEDEADALALMDLHLSQE
jgi:Holliday junction resolvasome RuvABC endonuclease subunit